MVLLLGAAQYLVDLPLAVAADGCAVPQGGAGALGGVPARRRRRCRLLRLVARRAAIGRAQRLLRLRRLIAAPAQPEGYTGGGRRRTAPAREIT